MDDLNTDRALECVHHVFPGVECDDPLVQREDGLVARPHPANLNIYIRYPVRYQLQYPARYLVSVQIFEFWADINSVLFLKYMFFLHMCSEKPSYISTMRYSAFTKRKW